MASAVRLSKVIYRAPNNRRGVVRRVAVPVAVWEARDVAGGESRTNIVTATIRHPCVKANRYVVWHIVEVCSDVYGVLATP